MSKKPKVIDTRAIEFVLADEETDEIGERLGFAIELGAGQNGEPWLAFTVHPMADTSPGFLGRFATPALAYLAIVSAEEYLDAKAAAIAEEVERA